MIKSIGIIFVISSIFVMMGNKFKIPPMISMIVCGIFLGDQCLNLLDADFMLWSGEIRKIALIIILLRVGFSLKIEDFKSTSKQALGLSFLPATFEIMGVVILAPIFFSITLVESLLLGAVLSAVSPAVVMPRMLNLIEKGYGVKKKIPQIILAGASLDDIYVLVLFTTFLSLTQTGEINLNSFLNIPVSIILGIILGVLVGYLLHKTVLKQSSEIKLSMKIIWLLGCGFLLITLEDMLIEILSISGLLAIISMTMFVSKNLNTEDKSPITQGIMNLWTGGELLLFTLVGSQVNISYVKDGGIKVVIFVLLVLLVRCVGVFMALIGSHLNKKERLFCIIAYLPKATVQAAIGSIPLSLGLPVGELILTTAVIAILITAPMGAIGIDSSYKKLLEHD